MPQLSALLGRVHDEFPGVPEAVALRALADATKEFCTRTHAWQQVIDPVTLVPGVSTYDLGLDAGVQLAAIKDIRLDRAKVYALGTEVPRRSRLTPTPSRAEFYTQVSPTSIELASENLDAGTLTIQAALTLRLDAQTADIPDSILDEYGEALAAGAKMRLVRQANQPWFAPDAAPLYATPFYTAVRDAKARAMSALGEADLQVEMRSW